MGYHGICTTISRRARGVPGALNEVLTALPRRPHGVTAVLLSKSLVTAFVLSMSERNADPWRSKIFHGVRLSSHSVATALLTFSPLLSALRKPRERRENGILV